MKTSLKNGVILQDIFMQAYALLEFYIVNPLGFNLSRVIR